MLSKKLIEIRKEHAEVVQHMMKRYKTEWAAYYKINNMRTHTGRLKYLLPEHKELVRRERALNQKELDIRRKLNLAC